MPIEDGSNEATLSISAVAIIMKASRATAVGWHANVGALLSTFICKMYCNRQKICFGSQGCLEFAALLDLLLRHLLLVPFNKQPFEHKQGAMTSKGSGKTLSKKRVLEQMGD